MNSPGDSPVCIQICSQPSYLPVVRAALGKLCENIGFDGDTAGQVVLSVDEALTNIIRHACGGDPDQVIEIEFFPCCDPGHEGLEIILRDYGKAIDPDQIKPRDLDEVRPGGLGLHIMKECMDIVEYTQAEGGGTRLRMFKNLTSTQEINN